MALPKLLSRFLREPLFSSPLSRGLTRRTSTIGCLVLASAVLITGCQDDTDLVRQIQNRRQAKQQTQSRQDHLGETFTLLRQYIDLEPEKAQRQIAYHLNRWSESKPAGEATTPELSKSIREIVPKEQLEARIATSMFQPSDALHLRDSFLFHSLYSWVDVESHDERLLTEPFEPSALAKAVRDALAT